MVSFIGLSAVSAQTKTDSLLQLSCSESGFAVCLPAAPGKNLEIVHHTAYSLGYSETHEQAAWVCYVLSKSECRGEEDRSSSFYEDDKVTSGSASADDYKASGYDRGHLAPAGDMTYSPLAMKESFYYSNMSPQVPSFNRGIWKNLETQVRDWGKISGPLLVLTGPLLTDSLPVIGPDSVAVPEWYYKIVVNSSSVPPQAIAFLLKNEASSGELTEFVVTIDDVEKLSGLDFLSVIPAETQAVLENHVNGSYWKGFESVKLLPPAPLKSDKKPAKKKKEKKTKTKKQ